jgi:hypothetical protein
LQLYFDNSRYHTTRAIQEEIEYLRFKQISHSAYSPDFAIVNLYLFGWIKEELRTMKASSGEEVLNIMTDILRQISQA